MKSWISKKGITPVTCEQVALVTRVGGDRDIVSKGNPHIPRAVPAYHQTGWFASECLNLRESLLHFRVGLNDARSMLSLSWYRVKAGACRLFLWLYLISMS